jgi:hypothetical protein
MAQLGVNLRQQVGRRLLLESGSNDSLIGNREFP